MNRKYKIILYNIFVSTLLLLIIEVFSLNESFFFMLLYSLHSCVVFFLLIKYEIDHFMGLSLNIILLFGYVMRLVLPSVLKAFGAMKGETFDFIFYWNDITDYMFPTIVWMNIYYMLFYWAFNKSSHNHTLDSVIEKYVNRYNISVIAIFIFIIGTIYQIIISYVPAGTFPGTINSIFGNLTMLAILAQIFNTLLSYKGTKKSILYIFLVVEILRTSFFGFYKGPIMMAFAFYVLYYSLQKLYSKQRLINIKIIVLGLTFLAISTHIIYPFMTIKRNVSGWNVTNGGIATNSYSNIEILKEVLSGETKLDSDINTTSRLDAIDPNAFFYKEVITKKFHSSTLLISNIELLVPRFINPNKHDSQAGLMVTSYANGGGFENFSSAVSNNYVGQFASAYMIGGGILAVIFALLNGFFIMFYYEFLIKHHSNIISLLLLVALLMETIYAFEEIHDGGVLRLGIKLAYMLIILVTSKIVNIFHIRHYSI